MKPHRSLRVLTLTLVTLVLSLAALSPDAWGQNFPYPLTVTASPNPAKPGEVVNFTFTVSNPTTTPLDGNGVNVNWTVPNFVSGSPSGVNDAVNYITIAPGQSYVFYAAYKVDAGSASDGRPAPADGSVMRLNATVTLSGKGSATTAAEVVIDSTPTLSVSVSDDAGGSAAPGQTVTYTVTTTNRGRTAASNTRISAQVPSGTSFVSATDGGTLNGQEVSWPALPIAPGIAVTRRFSLRTGNGPGVVLAQALASDLSDVNNRAAATAVTLVRALPLVGLTVTASPNPAKPGEVVNFTFTVSNPTSAPINGNGVNVFWTVPNFVSGSPSGVNDNVNYITIAPGQNYIFNKTYKVDAGSASDGRPAPADGSVMRLDAYLDFNSGNKYGATTAAEVVIDSTPTLSVSVSDDAGGSAAPGQTVTYTVTTTNRGATAVGDTMLRAPVPSGATLVSASDGGALNEGEIRWSLGPLAPGAVVKRTVGIRTGDAAAGSSLFIQALANDLSDVNNRAAATAVTLVRALPLVGLTVTASPNPAKPGEVVNFTFTVSNPTSAPINGNGVNVFWTVPNFVSGSPSGVNDNVNYITIAPGQNYIFNKTYKVDAGSASDGRPAPADGSVMRLDAYLDFNSGNKYGATTAAEVLIQAPKPPATGPVFVSVVGNAARGGFVLSRAGSLDLPVTVLYHNGGSANRGVDYVQFPGSLTLAAGQNEAIIPVTLLPGANRGKKVKVLLDPSPDGTYGIGKAQSKVFLSDLP